MSVVTLSPFAVDAVDTDVTTSDGEAKTVRGALQAQVVDPVAAVVKVADYQEATRLLLRTAMRALVMKQSSAELREGRQFHPPVADEVVDGARNWGVVVSSLTFDVAAGMGR